MPRWTAAQMLSQIALEKSLKLREWRSEMDGKILPAQLKLHEAIVQGRIIDIRGRRGPPGSKERIEEILSDSEFTLLVTPYGTLTVHPPHKLPKFMEKYRINSDNWVREIDFDQDEGERVFSPCQGQLDRPHLRLVPGARSGEIEAPAARAEESRPSPAPPTASVELLSALNPDGQLAAEDRSGSHPGGRPPVVNWSMVGEEVFRLMTDNGEFSADDPEWNAQARLEEAIAAFCAKKFKQRPSVTTIRRHIRGPLERWRRSRSET
jgi:hypothetical protein